MAPFEVGSVETSPVENLDSNESRIGVPQETGDWQDSIELPEGTDGWVDSIELPSDAAWQDAINLDNTAISLGIKETEDSQESPEKEKKGGSYKDVRVEGEGDRYEVHHMPADSASNLDRGDGPAIKMEKEDHRQTASCGMSREAREYREKQRELIEQGEFREALQMDIDDIREKFGDKYDDAIAEMLEYVDQLEQEGKI